MICSTALLGACATPKPATRPSAATTTATVAPGPSPAADSGLYSAPEALSDALSGPLEYVGSGPWPDMERVEACVFRNQRVVIVNAYCTLTESSVFRIDVYSPTRGRVRIYAEGKGPISAQTRQSYFSFNAVSEQLPDPLSGIGPLALNMSFPELRDYDRKRYEAFLPACYGGTELNQARSGCLGPLAPQAAVWQEQHRAFLDRASDDWYNVLRAMRTLASQYGKDPVQEED